MAVTSALNGLVLLGNGKNRFTPLPMRESGICMFGNGRAIATLQTVQGYTSFQNKQVHLAIWKIQILAGIDT